MNLWSTWKEEQCVLNLSKSMQLFLDSGAKFCLSHLVPVQPYLTQPLPVQTDNIKFQVKKIFLKPCICDLIQRAFTVDHECHSNYWNYQNCTSPVTFKRTVARSHYHARRASRARWTRQVNTPRAQDNLSKLLATLSAIAAPSAGTLQSLCTFLVRVPALGAAMVENAVSHLTRARSRINFEFWGKCSK